MKLIALEFENNMWVFVVGGGGLVKQRGPSKKSLGTAVLKLMGTIKLEQL